MAPMFLTTLDKSRPKTSYFGIVSIEITLAVEIMYYTFN